MTRISKTEVICDTPRVKCVIEQYRTKIYPTPDSVGISAPLWRVIVNGVVVNDYLTTKPRKARLEKYIRV